MLVCPVGDTGESELPVGETVADGSDGNGVAGATVGGVTTGAVGGLVTLSPCTTTDSASTCRMDTS